MATTNHPNLRLDKFLFSKNVLPDVLSDFINKYGFAIIPEFLSTDETLFLSNQFNAVQNGEIEGIDEEKLAYRTTHYSFTKNVIKNKLNRNTGVHGFKHSSVIHKITFNSLLTHVVDKFYPSDCNYLYPSRYQFMDTFDYPPERKKRDHRLLPYDLHFDRQQLLKFFFYTTNVTLDSGPLVAVPDERVLAKNKEIQKRHRLTDASWEEVDQFLEIDESLEIPAVVPMGSLVILDSDVPHRQAQVRNNQRRKCMVIEAQTLEEAFYTKNIKIN
ncbi:MAG: phytanoyl-CoA dioxygenase family protein [Verrucomicrobiota bacterium]|nr:phytanoyl-CoA dioxygenase family protein [Verrucomicrobiota bacterium]